MTLTRTKILDTAYELLSQYGLADLSMRRLASELGVAPGALYYHVRNKQELLASLASRMVEQIYFVGTDPSQALLTGALELRTRLLQVREAAEVIRVALALRPEELAFIERAAELFSGITDSPKLAATTLLHLSISLLEEEQTRATLAGGQLPANAPSSFQVAVTAAIAGWITV